jgi:polyphenol oxidase
MPSVSPADHARVLVTRYRLWAAAALLAPSLVAAPAAADSCDPPVNAADKSPGSYAKPLPFKAETGPARVRKSAKDLTPQEVQRLQDAYAKLRALSATDARSWMAQANVHCYFCAGKDSDQIHGSWFFFPWHRAYLYFHERILASLVNDPTFTLPYWDWESDGHIPDAYKTGSTVDDKRRPLPLQSAGCPASMVGKAVLDGVMALSSGLRFLGSATASGGPEGAPHGPVHIWVGNGDKPDMGLLQTAARDPVFYAHHSNIDRLWTVWIKQGAPGHGNPSAKAWLSKTWKFVNADGKWVSISVKDVLDHAKTLGYRYETETRQAPAVLAQAGSRGTYPKGTTRTKPPARAVLSPSASLKTTPTTYHIALPPEHKSVMLGAPGPGATSVLHIDGVEVPPDRSAMVRVFVNKPDATADTSVDDKHFAGYVVVVAKTAGHSHSHKALNITIELTPPLRTLVAQAGSLDVTLVPVGIDGKAPPDIQFSHKQIYLTAE